MILLDTTVLIYAVGSFHPLKDPCRTLIDAIGDERVRATATSEAIQKFTHVFSRRRNRTEAVSHGQNYLELLTPLVQPDGADLRRGLDLYEQYEALGCFDAVLVATAIGADSITGICSADKAFAQVAGVDTFDPSDEDFLTRLGIAPNGEGD